MSKMRLVKPTLEPIEYTEQDFLIKSTMESVGMKWPMPSHKRIDPSIEQIKPKVPDKVYDQGFFKEKVLTRWDSPQKNFTTGSVIYPPTEPSEFPQGMYFDHTSHGINSQYKPVYEHNEGSFAVQFLENPKAKVLEVKNPLHPSEVERWTKSGLYTTNAQTMGLRNMMSEKSFYRLANKDEGRLAKIAKRAYPNMDLSILEHGEIGGQAGKGGIMGIFAAQKAKSKGYDAIRYAKSEEYLAITSKAIMETSKGSRSIGWISKLASGAKRMSKAL